MNTPIVQKVKTKTTQLILKGTLWLIGIAIVIQLLLIGSAWAELSRDILSWVYVTAMLIFLIATWYARRVLKHSLSKSLYLFVGAATLAISIMLIAFLLKNQGNDLPTIVFGLDIAVFIVGLILGFKSATRYAYIVTGISIILGLIGGNVFDAIPVIFFAFLMIFPSWLVDRLEKNILEGEQKFSLVFQDSLDVIIIIEKTTGLIFTVNQATSKILHYAAKDLIGQTLAPLFPADAPLSPQSFFETLATQDELFGSQTFVCADGTSCPMDLTATNIQWGEQPAILLTLRDITERKQAEDEIQRYRDHLEDLVVERTAALQASNEELGAFAHTVAHDLKNPLSTLIGFGELLSTRFNRMATEQRLYAYNAITHMGRKMTNIIDELLLFSNIRQTEKVPMQSVAMHQVVQEALLRVTNLVEDYHPEIEVLEPWPSVWGNAAWTEEIWVNYISNAIKYGGDADRDILPKVTIGCDVIPPLATPNAPRTSIRFWVRDNGKGLTQEEQARLFTPFTRLNQVRAKGHGLGLSIAKRIIDKLGGKTGVTSTVGEGSTFYFVLPVNQPDDTVTAEPTAPDVAPFPPSPNAPSYTARPAA